MVMRGGFDTTKRRFGRLRRKFLFTATSPLKGLSLHGRRVAVVVEKNFVAAKLTGDDPPTAAENLKFFLTLNADAKFEALHSLKRIINVSNWVIPTNDNDGPA